MGSHSLLQGNFPNQGSNLGLLHCRRILCHLSRQGSPCLSLGASVNIEIRRVCSSQAEMSCSLKSEASPIFPESLLLPRRRPWQPTPGLLPGKSHGWRSLVGCSPRGLEELDTTERLPFHFSLSCTGEGNGNPLQCSCLENPRDGGAWWAAVYGVAQSRTRLK